MATTTTPILCPQCLAMLAIREELPANNNNLMLVCSHCGLGLMVDTTDYTTAPAA